MNEFIYYAHDGSDTAFDAFSLVAHAPEVGKSSVKRFVNVTVVPVNDEKPHVDVNEGLEVSRLVKTGEP